MAKGVPTGDKVRAEAIAALLSGLGVAEVARKLKLSEPTVSRIRNSIMPDRLKEVEREKAEQMDSLICDYLQSNFRALKAIAEAVSDASYIKKQSAAEVAELVDKLASTTFRLLEAESADLAAGEP